MMSRASLNRLLGPCGRNLGAMAVGPLAAGSVTRFYHENSGKNITSFASTANSAISGRGTTHSGSDNENLKANDNGKPPNVLVFAPRELTDRAEAARTALEAGLPADSYLVYLMNEEEAATAPWQESVALLILLGAPVSKAASTAVKGFSGLTLKWERTALEGLVASAKAMLNPREVSLASQEVPSLTSGRLICEDNELQCYLIEQGHLDSPDYTIQFLPPGPSVEAATANLLPLTIETIISSSTNNNRTEPVTFNENLFFRHLNTSDFGRVFIHTQVIGSTFQPFEVGGDDRGLVIPGNALHTCNSLLY